MRIAVIADIHGNLAALEAVLADVENLRPDRLIVAGDVVDCCPDSAPCWERVKALGCPVLRGNHERYVFDFGTERAGADWTDPKFGPLHFARDEFTAAQVAELAALPFSWSDPAAPGLLVLHATMRSDGESVLVHTPEEDLVPMFAGVAAPLIVRGHNHHSAIREWSGGRIVTSGSVGMPQDGNLAAQYVVLELRQDGWSVRHRAVRYDVEATLRRFRESGYLEKAGPMGRLFHREVATSTFQVLPFLRYQASLRAAGAEPSLAEAVERFLTS